MKLVYIWPGYTEEAADLDTLLAVVNGAFDGRTVKVGFGACLMGYFYEADMWTLECIALKFGATIDTIVKE